MMKLSIRLLLAVFLFVCNSSYAQNTYPKITAYVGIFHPIVTVSKSETLVNFRDFYSVSMPVGINLWKNEEVGFSFELIPIIKSENGTSRTSNILFQPGVLLNLGKGFRFAGRAAFETSGRYGFTPVISKTIIRAKNCSYYTSMPLLFRFGNDKDPSLGTGIQFGIAF